MLSDSALAKAARRRPAAERAVLYLDHMLCRSDARPEVEPPAHAQTPTPEPPPVAAGAPRTMDTKQRFDQADHQRMVQVFPKRHQPSTSTAPAAPTPQPSPNVGIMRAREDRFVEYVTRHPGCAMGDAIEALGESRDNLAQAARAAREAERVEMRGSSKRDMRYYPKAAAKSEAV